MDDDETAGLYAWAPGSCFKCARKGLGTTSLGLIDTPSGARYDVRACRRCLLDLECERRRYAARTGQEYLPGSLGA